MWLTNYKQIVNILITTLAFRNYMWAWLAHTFPPPIPRPVLLIFRVFREKQTVLFRSTTKPLTPVGPNALSLTSSSTKCAPDAINPSPRWFCEMRSEDGELIQCYIFLYYMHLFIILHTRASGISSFSRLTNMSLQRAFFNSLCFPRDLPIALAASLP